MLKQAWLLSNRWVPWVAALFVQVPLTVQTLSLYFDFHSGETWETMWTPVSGRWRLTQDPSAPSPPTVITQTADYIDFPKAHLKQAEFYDYEVEVALKIHPLRGETQPQPGYSIFELSPEKAPERAHPIDYAGGVLLRYRGTFAFVAAIADARTQSLYLIRMTVNGLRVLEREAIDVQLNRWHHLRAVCYLDRIHLFWDGKPVLQGIERFITGGRVGLITVGGSQVSFDDFRIWGEQVQRPGID